MGYKLLRLIHFWWCANFNFDRTKVGDNPHVGRGTNLFFPDFGFIGNNFYLGRYCSVEVNVKISDNVIIGNYCALVGRNDHKYDIPGVYMRHENSAREFSPKYDRKKEFIEIEKDVWIGHGTIILSNVKISKGCVIAAGSILTKSTEPYGIYAGVPAKRIKNRFTPEEIIIHENKLYN